MPVQAMTQFDPAQFFHVPSTDPTKTCGNGGCRLDTQVSGVTVSNDLSGRLTVTTAEGDKVTLTANLAEDFRAFIYQGASQQGGTSVNASGQAIAYSRSQELGITVEGDLNEQEVKDLSQLFRKVLDVFKKFYNGQDEAALAKTANIADRFGNLSSLAGVDLSIDIERSVSVVAAKLGTESGTQTGDAPVLPAQTATTSSTETHSTTTPGVAPSTAAVIPLPSSGTTAPTQPSTTDATNGTGGAAQVTAAPAEGDKPKSLVEQVLDLVQNAKVGSDKLRKYLPRLLDKVREDLQKELQAQTETGHKQTPDVSAQTGSAAILTYQATRQASLALSIHT